MILFYKTITKRFSVQDSVIHGLGMLLDFRKAEQKDLPAARMDDAILVQNHLVYPLVLYTLHDYIALA